MRNLYLFDIDGTLVDMTPAHLQTYQESYLALFERGPTGQSLVSKFGKLEEEMQREIFDELGLDKSRIHEFIEDFRKRTLINILSRKVEIKILPGVRDCLKYCGERGVCGIISGNPPDVGSAILNAADLYPFFSFFGFDEGERRRSQIVEKVIKKARTNERKFDRIVVLDDSISGIKAAKEVRDVFCVGIATGFYREDKLKQAGAEMVLNTLLEYNKL